MPGRRVPDHAVLGWRPPWVITVPSASMDVGSVGLWTFQLDLQRPPEARALAAAGLPVVGISAVTGFPVMMDLSVLTSFGGL